MFESLNWRDDRLLLNGLTFLLEGVADRNTPLDSRTFWLHKDRNLIGHYERFFADYPGLQPSRCLELGIWKGGSAVFWSEVLKPEKYVALDIQDKDDSPDFTAYREERGLTDRVKTYWRTDQADTAAVDAILRRDFGEASLDFVIDDASHAYAPTRRSFEYIFPRVRHGGVYIIEDWAWLLSPEHRAHFPPEERGLFQLVSDLTLLMALQPDLIERLDVRQPFFVVQRGPMPEAEARERLKDFMAMELREQRNGAREQIRRLRHRLSKAVRGQRA